MKTWLILVRMNVCKAIIIPVFLLILSELEVKAHDCDTKAEIVCYFASWAVYREDEGRFTTENIDPRLCTNVVYSFVGLNLDLQITSLDYNADINMGGFANVTNLKKENPCIKATLALGGWNEGSLKFSVMAATVESREKFADNALKFIAYYGFDGLDLDWEYPTSRGGISQDKANFVALLKTIKNKISPWGFKLSIAVGIENSYYDIAGIKDYVDYVHVMGYDITNANSNITGLLAPLSVITQKMNVWLENGLPKSKLVLGIPTYARCFNLDNADEHGIGAVVTTTTCGGPWTDEDGFLAFYEVQEMVVYKYCQGTEIVDDNVYSWCDDVWMTYDNAETVVTKAQYVLDEGLGGVMIWSIDTDDFAGRYGDKNTLLASIYNTINKS